LPPAGVPPVGVSEVVDHDPSVAERVRLEAQIAEARQRTAASVERARNREEAVRRALRAEIEATRVALADLDSRHRTALGMVHEAAELEIQRLRAAAPSAPTTDRADEW
jgi:uncharacterized sporulation protein YeaH/YhbH (DUF444 family)